MDYPGPYEAEWTTPSINGRRGNDTGEYNGFRRSGDFSRVARAPPLSSDHYISSVAREGGDNMFAGATWECSFMDLPIQPDDITVNYVNLPTTTSWLEPNGTTPYNPLGNIMSNFTATSPQTIGQTVSSHSAWGALADLEVCRQGFL